MFYVTMSDKGMSGWGLARGKINKIVFECETMEEAQIVSDNADRRPEMKRVGIRSTRPSYDLGKYFVSWKDKASASAWYKK